MVQEPTIKSKEAMKNRFTAIPPHETEGTELPAGGTTGQALMKKSDQDDDLKWGDVQTPLPEGTEGQVLAIGEAGLEFKTLGSAAGKDYTPNVAPGNHNLVESNAVYAAISAAISAVYEPHGELTCAELTSDLLVSTNVGNIYTMSDSGTTSDLFVQGSGKTISAGDSVAIIVAGPDVYKFNLMPGIVDLSTYQTKAITSVTIDGTAESTVEDAIGAFVTALAHRVYVSDTRTSDILTDAVSVTQPTIFNGIGSGYTGTLPHANFAYGAFIVIPRGSDITVLAVMGNTGIATCRYSNSVWSGWICNSYGVWNEIPAADIADFQITGTGTYSKAFPALANAHEIYLFGSYGAKLHIPDVSIARSTSESTICWNSSGATDFSGTYDKMGTINYTKGTQTLSVTICKSGNATATYKWALEKICYR